jgi:hypothetical protein
MKAELALVGAGIVPDVRAASAKAAELYIVEVRLDQCALHVNFCRLGPLNKWRPPLIDAPVQEIFGKGLDPMMGEPSGRSADREEHHPGKRAPKPKSR